MNLGWLIKTSLVKLKCHGKMEQVEGEELKVLSTDVETLMSWFWANFSTLK